MSDSSHERHGDQLITLVGLLFESSAGAMSVLRDAYSDSSELTQQLFEPLLRLSRSDQGRQRMSDLAAQTRMSVSTLTRVADRLETLGYAQRQSCPSDRRSLYLAITDAGRDALNREMPSHKEAIDTKVLGTLSSDERNQLEALLRRVRDVCNPDAIKVSSDDRGH